MKRLLLLMIPAMLLLSCHFTQPETLKNGKIDKSIRDAVQETNEQLISALMRNDITSFKNITSDALIDKMDKSSDSLLESYGKAIVDKNFKILDEYYTRVSSKNKQVTIENNSRKGMEYTLSYVALNLESYTSLLVVKVDSMHNALITVEYGKYGPNWLINIFRIGDYSFHGKNLKGLFNQAKLDIKDSNIVDAYLNIGLAKDCLQPAGETIHFKCDSAVNQYFEFVNNTAATKYTLPFTIATIDTKPEILNVSTKYFYGYGCFPLIRYKTSIPIDDTVRLKAENKLMRQRIGAIFKGIDKNKRFILYRAFNEVPNGSKEVNYYGFLDDLTDDDN